MIRGFQTRFDDIANDIRQEKVEKYLKSVAGEAPTKFYKLGDLIGEKLNNII